MSNREDLLDSLKVLLKDPKTREGVLNLVEELKKEDPEKQKRTELAVDELYNYLCHINIVAQMANADVGYVGNVTKYSAFSFGDASGASYEIDEEGNLVVDVDFSSFVKRYPCDTAGYDRRINPDFVDFVQVREGLMEKYGIDFDLSYTEEKHVETEINGSDDMEASYDMTHYTIDSHMRLKGKVKEKEKQAAQLRA